ncbi:MAG: endonuclease III [Ignavibacteriaceae bacterium]|nr:endonuclease III [Ignavibacteriaceae bacterium]
MKSKIIKINNLLIGRFGFPSRSKVKPTPINTLIATILSQNTNDKNSYIAYKNLKANFKSWNELSSATVTEIEKLIRVGGLAKQKARAIKDLINKLKNQNKTIDLKHISKLNNRDAIIELTSFNGVGVKTASCVLLFSMNRNVCPVDTHVHRTLNRIGLVKTKSADKTFWLLNQNFPDGIAHVFHTNLIKLGRDICKSTNPLCESCPLFKICSFPQKNLKPAKKSNQTDFLLLDNI